MVAAVAVLAAASNRRHRPNVVQKWLCKAWHGLCTCSTTTNCLSRCSMFATSTIRACLAPAAAAAAMLCAAPAAQAYDGALGSLSGLSSTFQVGNDFPSPTFSDSLSFSVLKDSIGSFSAKGQGFAIPFFFTLAPATDVSFAIYKGATALTGFSTSFTDVKLAMGDDYSFLVKGGSGGYTVAWSLAAAPTTVPEPEAIAMVLAGIAVVGGMSRRRRTTTAA
jgi:hypothetical protein